MERTRPSSFRLDKIAFGLRYGPMGSLRELDTDLARGVIAAASDAIVVIDERGTVVFASPQADVLWGYKAGELEGRAFRGLRERDEASRAPRACAEFIGVRRDGTEFDATVRLSPVPTPDATFVAVVVRNASGSSGPRASANGASPPDGESSRAGGAGGPGAAARARVLIIDDDAAVAKTLGRILGEEHTCTVALGGREAIALIGGGERYDAILCDMSMPDAGGEDVHREVAALAPDLAQRIIFVSGGAFTSPAQAFLARIDNPQISKPFEAQSIRTLVRDMVARAASFSKR